ncbi:MAG TPA: hypothetical protein EYH06_06370 [Chromatiales bacterium]|nr:hypothetical protein [Thiotrichales bacterium]HIP68205.1 hypothetical protein [Chromatiales bacterium]
MKFMQFIAGSILATGMLFTTAVMAEEVTRFTVEQYQIAIEQFGVSPEEAKAAAERAVAAQKAAETESVESDDILAKLPSDFLEGSAY